MALRVIIVRLGDVYQQGVHAQNPADMEHAGLTIHVSVIQAGMENYVIKVSDWKLTAKVKLSLLLISVLRRHEKST
jgi:hypothetical protein